MIFRLMTILVISSATVLGAGWQCRNDVEVTCSNGNCRAQTAEGFTPMSVSFDETGVMSVCAYSGCWEGKGKVFTNGSFLMLNGLDLAFSTNPNSPEANKDVAITFDRSDSVAMIKAGSFVQPLLCEKALDQDETGLVPTGWQIEEKTAGDLNGDGLIDSVLQINNKKSDENDFERSLIILLKESNGRFIKAAEAKRILRCSLCGGMLGGGPAEITIEKGVLVVKQYYGSRWATDYLHRFRLEPKSGKFRLIGEDIDNYDRATGKATVTSTNFLTGRHIVTKEQLDQKTDKRAVISKREKRITGKKTYIEEVDFDSY